ncbi:MAG: integrase [Deltaproteobacteria bacterium]|jgi:integrase/recombinase XerC|nr:MAG: integrase [Deltaproteobacteria bacterium]
MEELIKEFIDSLARRETTKETYLKALREFSKWLGGSSPLGLTSNDIQKYKDELISKNLSPTSLSTYLTAVRRFYDYLILKGFVSENPAKKIKGSKRPQRHLRAALTPEEVEKLLGSIDTSSPVGLRDWTMINFMVRCGLSEIEIVRANVGDIKIKGGKQVIFVQGKSKDKKDEYVILPPQVQEALKRYLEGREKTEEDEPLFWGVGNRAKGGRITTRAIRERVNHYLKLAGIKREGITPYSLRHTAAILAIESGAAISEVKQMLRHKTVDSTLVYFEEAEELKRSKSYNKST